MRPKTEREGGFSLPELLVTTLLVGIVTLVLLNTSDALTRTAATTQSRSASLADARTAIERIAKDLRAANPVNPLTSGFTSQFDTSVAFDVFCTAGAGCVSGLRPVKYVVAGGVLTQTIGANTAELLGPNGTPSLPVGLRRGAIVNTASQPVFTYYRRDGSQIATSVDSTGIPSTYFRDCTKRVRIHLVVRSEPNKADRVTDLVTDVTLRNHNEVNPC